MKFTIHSAEMTGQNQNGQNTIYFVWYLEKNLPKKLVSQSFKALEREAKSSIKVNTLLNTLRLEIG